MGTKEVTQSRAHCDSEMSLTTPETERGAGRSREDREPITELKQPAEGVGEVSPSLLGFLLRSTN